MLETLELATAHSSSKSYPQRSKSLLVTGEQCYYCNGAHWIYNCTDFLKLNRDARSKQVVQKKLCFNCLRPGYVVKKCKSGSCKQCRKKTQNLASWGWKKHWQGTHEKTYLSCKFIYARGQRQSIDDRSRYRWRTQGHISFNTTRRALIFR